MEDCSITRKQKLQLILLADDDHDDVFLFRDIIDNMHDGRPSLNVVDNGPDALKSLRELPEADIVFLDMNMPRMNGLECLTEIRNLSKTIPVIILTTSSSETLIRQAKALGASGFISKPGNFNRYLKVLNEVLSINWKNADTGFYLHI